MGTPVTREKALRYAARLVWTGNTGDGTASYAGYGRDHTVHIAGKPALQGSADAAFHGTHDRHNPEDLFLASIAGCHMLSYLALCARQGVRVLSYECEATGTLALRAGGGGAFEDVLLSLVVTIADEAGTDVARRLHVTAHERCFIANSCSVAIRHEVTVLARGECAPGGGAVAP